MIPSDSAQKKNNHQPVFDFFFFIFTPFFGDESHFLLSTNFLISASIRDRITHIYITSPWCWQKIPPCLYCAWLEFWRIRLMHNVTDDLTHEFWHSEKKKTPTWNTKQMANDKMILIYAIKDICNYMQ